MSQDQVSDRDDRDPGSADREPVSLVGPVDRAADRDPVTGQFVAGNAAKLQTGQYSRRFWSSVEPLRRELVRAVIADAGFDEDDAPRVLRVAAEGLAQAVLLRDASFQRLLDTKGPLTPNDRTRRPFAVWANASDRVERLARLVGLARRPRRVPGASAADAFAADLAERLRALPRTDGTRDEDAG